jgi:hypothetical protein
MKKLFLTGRNRDRRPRFGAALIWGLETEFTSGAVRFAAGILAAPAADSASSSNNRPITVKLSLKKLIRFSLFR